MQLSELGELGLLAELERRGLARGIDHDAAQLDGGVIATQDALVEGVHFRLDWISWRDLGWRAAAVNLSDLAASGADPEGLLVTLGTPPETEVRNVLDLEHVPLADGAELADLGFGEDYELLAAVEDPGRFRVVGRCEEGEGLVLTLSGEPYELGGWQHFR